MKRKRKNSTNGRKRDITERMRLEETLRENEEKYRAIVENSPNFIGILQDGILKYVNRAATERLGWTYEELVSSSFDPMEKAVAERFRGLIKENVGRRLRGEDMPPYEISLTTRDGSEIPVIVRAAKIVYQGRAAVEFAFGDITDWKRMEEALRKSEGRYRSLFQSMLEGVAYCKMILDDNGRPVDFVYLDVNSAFSRLTGLEDVVGKRATEVIPGIKEENPELFEIYGRVVLTGKSERFEIDLKSLAMSLAISVSSPTKGNFVAVFENVTERKRMEEELRRSGQFLESIIENANVWLDVLDEEKNVVIWNKAAETMSGYSREEVVGHRKIWEWLYPYEEYRKQITDSVADVLQRGKAEQDVETNIRRKDGQTRIISWNERNLLDKHGKVIGSIAIGRDVTEQKQMREELERYSKHLEELVEERTKKLRQAERLAAVGETAAMVGHDLRNPLQGIAGAAYNMRKHLRNAPDPSTREMLAVIDNGVEYANGIINDLLEFSREMQLQLLPTTPKSIVKEALTEVNIPENIRIEDTTSDAPQILADEPKIRRVLTNLIENAIDAMPEGGELSISNMNSQREVSISVTDTGIGISQDEMEGIWTPLYTTKAKGIGLGLPICKRLAEAHGGSVSVESIVGKGTTFTLKLPIEHVQARGEPS